MDEEMGGVAGDQRPSRSFLVDPESFGWATSRREAFLRKTGNHDASRRSSSRSKWFSTVLRLMPQSPKVAQGVIAESVAVAASGS